MESQSVHLNKRKTLNTNVNRVFQTKNQNIYFRKSQIRL